jgi:deoxyribodipyrimidine photolyase
LSAAPTNAGRGEHAEDNHVTKGRQFRRILVWFRRALRVDDNMVLWNAMQDAEEVVPVLCISDDPSYQILTERRKFLRSAIHILDVRLRERGSALHVRVGRPEVAIPAAASAYHADPGGRGVSRST